MNNKYKYLSKNIILFTISGFVPKILSFILVPIYTSQLTTAEYGIADLLVTSVALFIPIFTLDIQDAVMRFALDEMYKKEEVFSVALKVILIGILIIIFFVLVIWNINIPNFKNNYLIFFLVMYFTTAFNNTVSLFCRGIDKVHIIVTGSIMNSIITLIANIMLLVYCDMGLTGYLIANSLGSAAALIWCFVGAKLYRYIKWRGVSKKLQKDMIGFSFPLIFSVIAWWINNASDRYMLSVMSGIAVSGVYAVAYKIPTLLSVFQNVFSQAWSISAVKEFDKNDSDGFIGNMYNMMNCGMIFICSCLIIYDIPIAKLLYANEFFEAWRFVPPLLISVVFNAMALFIGSIFTAVKDTKTLSISTIVGALVNIICNFCFIYYWDAYGAALATLIGYLVVFIIRHIILQKHIHIKVIWTRDILAYGCLIIQMVVAIFGIKYIAFQILLLLIIMFLYRKELCKLKNTVWKVVLKR